MNFITVRSLRSKILFLFIILLLVVQLVSFFTTYLANQKLESTQLNNRIVSAKDVFQTQFNNRRYYLSAFAETAAKDYGLKSVLNEDQKSFLVALNNHRKRINSDIAMAIDSNGKIIGQLISYENELGEKKVKVGARQGELFDLKSDIFDEENTNLVQLNGELYQLSLAPIKSGSRNIGWIGFGYVISRELAVDFANLTNVNIGFFIKHNDQYQVIASSTVNESYVNEEFIVQLRENTLEDYIFRKLTLGKVEQGELFALLFESKADVLKTAGVDWLQLFLLIGLTLALSVISALAIAQSITKPIQRLISQVKSVAQGSYTENVKVDGSVELQQLSDEFNRMTTAIISREETISFQAFHDPLTHLPNRNSLINTLTKRKNAGHSFWVIQLCLLGAEEIYDTLGYKFGDEIIIEVANHVVKTELNLSCYHLGGEGFVLLANEQAIEPLLAKLTDRLLKNCQHNNINLHLQYALGLASSDLYHSAEASEILQKTNVALQHAIKNKLTYQIYDPQFDINAVERLFLTNSLKEAIEQDELTLHYQPKLSLNTMTISHVEALVRWQHPEKGLIPPDSFISIAEKTGQMDALTRWVTSAAIEQYVQWRNLGIDINIAINISAENIKDKRYSDFVINLKKEHQLDDNAITLEVTEDAVVSDPKRATEILWYLKENGFKLSIDDYGTGYSSLAQLKLLPVHELKIDRSFVQHLSTDDNDKIIVKSTLELAHNMNLSVVAEGIEDETALLWLKDNGCQLAQGYFISKPLPANTFEQWINSTPYLIKKVMN